MNSLFCVLSPMTVFPGLKALCDHVSKSPQIMPGCGCFSALEGDTTPVLRSCGHDINSAGPGLGQVPKRHSTGNASAVHAAPKDSVSGGSHIWRRATCHRPWDTDHLNLGRSHLPSSVGGMN